MAGSRPTEPKKPPAPTPWKREGLNLRAWRKGAKLRLRDMTSYTGISQGQLSKIENGQQPYTQGTLEGYARAVNRPPWQLLAGPPTSSFLTLQEIWERARNKQRLIDLAKILDDDDAH